MKFAIMHAEPRGESETLAADEMNRRVRRHQEKLNELATARMRSGPPGLIFATTGLSSEREVVTVKRENGRHECLDGPFPETKEVIGGFDLIEFASRQEAIEWSKALHVHQSYVSQLRPIRELWWMSGFVDRPRLMDVERWPEAPGRNAKEESVAAQVFMLTAVEDEGAMSRLPENERKEMERQHRRAGAEYVRQRSAVEHQPGMWVGARLSASTDTTTIRWSNGAQVVSAGPSSRTREVITGFDLVACSQDEAISWARKLVTRAGGAIEIRPVRGCWWLYRD